MCHMERCGVLLIGAYLRIHASVNLATTDADRCLFCQAITETNNDFVSLFSLAEHLIWNQNEKKMQHSAF